MHSVVMVVVLELFELSCEIPRIPERHLIKNFAANGPDEPLSERT